MIDFTYKFIRLKDNKQDLDWDDFVLRIFCVPSHRKNLLPHSVQAQDYHKRRQAQDVFRRKCQLMMTKTKDDLKVLGQLLQ